MHCACVRIFVSSSPVNSDTGIPPHVGRLLNPPRKHLAFTYPPFSLSHLFNSGHLSFFDPTPPLPPPLWLSPMSRSPVVPIFNGPHKYVYIRRRSTPHINRVNFCVKLYKKITPHKNLFIITMAAADTRHPYNHFSPLA